MVISVARFLAGLALLLVRRIRSSFMVRLREDLVGGLGPDEGMAAVVSAVDEGPDLGVEVPDRAVGAAVDGLAFDHRESDLDQVHPGGAGRGEVADDPRVRGQPLRHDPVLVGGVVVHHQVQLGVGVGARDLLEEG